MDDSIERVDFLKDIETWKYENKVTFYQEASFTSKDKTRDLHNVLLADMLTDKEGATELKK